MCFCAPLYCNCIIVISSMIGCYLSIFLHVFQDSEDIEIMDISDPTLIEKISEESIQLFMR
ncbi:hypothetical protein MUK42_36074 [Musa troglodytarum]|uniref:Uncharacterized protein n=1 Tax=Musa troglodytarum TaxID=320322 RepID=A0A9E7FF86_9LILI|nr:hypothetical protein MUK42_36074 [Musa troglodytarum]